MPRRNDSATGVQELIDALAISRAELARRVGVSRATLQSWAVGRRTPRPRNARRLARIATEHGRQVERLAERLLRSTADDTAER